MEIFVNEPNLAPPNDHRSASPIEDSSRTAEHRAPIDSSRRYIEHADDKAIYIVEREELLRRIAYSVYRWSSHCHRTPSAIVLPESIACQMFDNESKTLVGSIRLAGVWTDGDEVIPVLSVPFLAGAMFLVI
jgi:hypothetical protein